MNPIVSGVVGLVQDLDHDLTLRQLAALALLSAAAKPIPVREVAGTLGIHKPATSRALVALERRGWIQRTKGEVDRRDVLVAATAAGRRAMDEIVTAMTAPRGQARAAA